jgi:hypothetical protein
LFTSLNRYWTVCRVLNTTLRRNNNKNCSVLMLRWKNMINHELLVNRKWNKLDRLDFDKLGIFFKRQFPWWKLWSSKIEFKKNKKSSVIQQQQRKLKIMFTYGTLNSICPSFNQELKQHFKELKHNQQLTISNRWC